MCCYYALAHADITFDYRKPLLPIESELIPSDGNSDGESNVEDYCDRMTHLKKELFSKAKQNIKSAQKRYKKDFDKKHCPKKVHSYRNFHSIVDCMSIGACCWYIDAATQQCS